MLDKQIDIGPYALLDEKGKEIASQIENSLSGMNYQQAELLLLAVIQQIRTTSVLVA